MKRAAIDYLERFCARAVPEGMFSDMTRLVKGYAMPAAHARMIGNEVKTVVLDLAAPRPQDT